MPAPLSRRMARPGESTDLIVVGASVGGLAAADPRRRSRLPGRACSSANASSGEGPPASRRTSPPPVPASSASPGSRTTRSGSPTTSSPPRAAPLDPETVHAPRRGRARPSSNGSPTAVAWAVVLASEAAQGTARRASTRPTAAVPDWWRRLARVAGHVSRISLRPGVIVDELLRDEQGAVIGVSARSRPAGAAAPGGGRCCSPAAASPPTTTLVAHALPRRRRAPLPRLRRAPPATACASAPTVGAPTRSMSACRRHAVPRAAGPPRGDRAARGARRDSRRTRRAAASPTSARTRLTARARDRDAARAASPTWSSTTASPAPPARPIRSSPRPSCREPAGVRSTLADLARSSSSTTEALDDVDVASQRRLGGDPVGRTTGALAAPFHAIRVTGARRRTLGGLAVDARAACSARTGSPIAGLYRRRRRRGRARGRGRAHGDAGTVDAGRPGARADRGPRRCDGRRPSPRSAPSERRRLSCRRPRRDPQVDEREEELVERLVDERRAPPSAEVGHRAATRGARRRRPGTPRRRSGGTVRDRVACLISSEEHRAAAALQPRHHGLDPPAHDGRPRCAPAATAPRPRPGGAGCGLPKRMNHLVGSGSAPRSPSTGKNGVIGTYGHAEDASRRPPRGRPAG